MANEIVVVGSAHMDLSVQAPRLPEPGETLLGGETWLSPGGKGLNQAVAASRLGATVRLIGCVGDDAWGSELRATLVSEGIDVAGLATREDARTGAGIVTVLPDGENAIVVSPGASATLSARDVERHDDSIREADVLVLQLEVPLEALAAAIEIAVEDETLVVLNAAPMRELPPELLGRVGILVVNETEARQMAQVTEDVGAKGLARRLTARGPQRVVITRGRQGALYFDGERLEEQDSWPVESVDSTAAGDAFVGALAVAFANGERLEHALRRACAAGSLATTIEGSMRALPTREALDALLAPAAEG